tara:strand:- start:1757 stop:2860 length:1104 start_codon:yes stop_codon:yes gene_type:complete
MKSLQDSVLMSEIIEEEGNNLVLSSVSNSIGHITLNRPSALNALNLPMMQRLLDLITTWQNFEGISCILIKGNSPRAFCSGGDLRSVYEAYQSGNIAFLERLFRTEYTYNAHLKAFTKPHVALIHGIVMGGGVGASLHGSHRVMTNSTIFAMPETGIGYFPDIGGTYFLTRCAPEIGLYIGLTGARLSGSDALYAGFATHYCDESDFNTLENHLEVSAPLSHQEVDSLLQDFKKTPPPSTLQNNQELLKRCFLKPTLEGVFEALSKETDSFAKETLTMLTSRSPLSLQITFHQLTTGQNLSFNDVMKREFIMSQNLLKKSDFIEGIRAAVIDKDRSPRWSHDSFQDLTQKDILPYFEKPQDLTPLDL